MNLKIINLKQKVMTTIHRIEIPVPFPIGSANCYFIEDSLPTLIDAGFYSEDSLRRVSLALEKIGYRFSDIRRVLLTHGHIDHVGLAGEIFRISGAAIFIHPMDRNKITWGTEKKADEKMEGFTRFLRKAGVPKILIQTLANQVSGHLKKFFPEEFDVKYIEDGENFAFDGFSLRVLLTPGHTSGSVCFFDPMERRLFSGDHLLENISPNPLIEIENQDKGRDYKSLSSYLNSLEIIRNLDVSSILPGHGPPFSNYQKRINAIIDHHRMRKEEILNILKNYSEGHGMTLFAINQQLFSDLEGYDIFLGLSETHAHLQILEGEGLVRSHREQVRQLYSLNPPP